MEGAKTEGKTTHLLKLSPSLPNISPKKHDYARVVPGWKFRKRVGLGCLDTPSQLLAAKEALLAAQEELFRMLLRGHSLICCCIRRTCPSSPRRQPSERAFYKNMMMIQHQCLQIARNARGWVCFPRSVGHVYSL